MPYDAGAAGRRPRQGRFSFDRLIRCYELKDIDEALAASSRGDVLKPVLTMPH